MTRNDSEFLAEALKRAAVENDAVPGISDSYGHRYIIGFYLEFGERTATIRSCWILLTEETAPRFVTCYVL
jgi:hypothetical protein